MKTATRSRRLALFSCTILGFLPAAVFAAEASPQAVVELQKEVQLLKEEQARRIAEFEHANARIGAIEQQLVQLGGTPLPAQAASAPATGSASAIPANAGWGRGMAAAGLAPSSVLDGLDLAGDVRLRYESNFFDGSVRNRGRGVIRARLRTSYQVNDWLKIGGQVATGDPDDPNTTDVSLSNFDDDLAISLDQAYLQAKFGGLTLTGGKFANPFERTDLVWDSDVNPQGLAASYSVGLSDGITAKINGLYFLVDEQVAGPDSDMIGAQAVLGIKPSPDIQINLAGSYYDYTLKSVAGADSGDFRSNLLRLDGRYLSDFDLVNLIGTFTYSGLGERWPVQLAGEYVKNVGAATSSDTGLSGGLTVGRASKPGDWRFGYGYMEAETDAVLAAFSHDNLTLATNYLMHSLAVDYVPRSDVVLNATLYHFRKKDPLGPGAALAGDWINRLRLNLLVNF